MLFPYSTDAPIYHRPAATVGLVAVNTVVFIAQLVALQSPGGEKLIQAWCLELGGGVHPVQWVTANFLHAGILHLVGNMFGVWAFGLIVEGKIGWLRFLIAYLAIGALVMMITQFVSLGMTPNFGLGASGAVFGLLGMCLVWAPENEFSCLLLIGFRAVLFDIQVRWLALIYIGLNAAILFFTQRPVSTEAIHTLGAVAGFAVAVVMLRKGWVDCENWDLFSVWAGRHTMSEEDRAKLDRKKREARFSEADVLARRQQTREAALAQISALVDEGRLQLAIAANARIASQFDDWLLPEPVLYKLLAGCFRKDQDVDPVPLAVEYLRHYRKAAVVVRLKLAETLIRKQQRPAQAMRVLSKLPRTGLNAKEEAFRRGLQEGAAAIKSGPMEPATEDW
jgi:membrane associated rhomboid family serine protease